ncbi:YjbH domain-containing protein [Niveispirillum irakense]|uniref:YjbH domain-containing protein n=1 Tax=Niveispirillum irakense TaxID=34011 RepID=UPI0006864294|nr:YjbH domain-containing protein [Niveispirillum irakense]
MVSFRNRLMGAVAVGACLSVASPARAEETSSGAQYSVNDYGHIGLFQTPTARMNREGQFHGGASFVWPNRRYFITLQAMPWLETTLRYTDVRNALYGPEEFSGDQTYKDRGFDLKLRLMKETDWLPDLSVGMRDIAGTGFFQSEYVVANKQFGPWDASLGMAWGQLGSRGHFDNPLGLFSDRFKTRPGFSGEVGNLGNNYFRGEQVALFGGVRYQTPVPGLALMAEYDSNAYRNEVGGALPVDLPINAGVTYTPWGWLQIGLGVERGNKLLFRVVTTTNFNDESRVPKVDPPPPPLQPRPAPALLPAAASAFPPLPESPSDPQPSPRDQTVRISVASQAALDGLRLVNTVQGASGLELTVAGSPYRDAFTAAMALATRAALADPDLQGGIHVRMVELGQERLRMTFDAAQLRHTPSILGDMAEPADSAAPVADAPPVMVDHSPQVLSAADGAPTVAEQKELERLLKLQGFGLVAADYKPYSVRLYLTQNRYRRIPQAIGRAARSASVTLPARFEEISIVLMEKSIETLEATIMRTDLEYAETPGRGSLGEVLSRARFEEPALKLNQASHPAPSSYPTTSFFVSPAFRQTIGRPEAFFLYQLWMRVGGSVQLGSGLSVFGAVGIDIYNNFDKLRIPSDSVLPHVRSDIKEYLAEGTTALTHAQLDYNFTIAQGWYGHLYGGLLDEMFGGVGGEVLYRPFGRNWAVGADLNWVRQRDYNQWFDFRNYDTLTGHLTGYYYIDRLDLNTQVSVGRYLAKDVGATFNISRTFDSGITVGAFATFTDVSSRDFGEGSFDKGIYISIPLDQLYVRSVRGSMGWGWRPLVRDGGQMLGVRGPLISTTGSRDMVSFQRTLGTMLD